jgi:hypothetical protein
MEFVHSTKYLQEHRFETMSSRPGRGAIDALRTVIGMSLVNLGNRIQTKPVETAHA